MIFILPCQFGWLSLHGVFLFVSFFFFLVLSSCFQYGFREIPLEYIQAKFGVTRKFGLFMFNILMEILGLLFTKSLCLSSHPMYFFHDLYAVFSCVYFKEIIIHFILFV